MPDDTWRLISMLCQRVCEEGNVYLDILVMPKGMEIMLLPYEDWEEDDEE